MSPQSRRRWSLAGILIAAAAFGWAWGADDQPGRAVAFGIAAVVYAGAVLVPSVRRARSAAAHGHRLRRPDARQWAWLVGVVVLCLGLGYLLGVEREAVTTLLVTLVSVLAVLLAYWLTPRRRDREGVND